MEHKIYNRIRKYKLPFFLRFSIMITMCTIGFIIVIVPLPFSILIGISLIIFGTIFVISPRDIKPIVKIRKGIIFSTKNILHKKNRNHKIKDIKKHIKQILDNNK